MASLQSCELDLGEFDGSIILDIKNIRNNKYAYINLHLNHKQIGFSQKYQKTITLISLKSEYLDIRNGKINNSSIYK